MPLHQIKIFWGCFIFIFVMISSPARAGLPIATVAKILFKKGIQGCVKPKNMVCQKLKSKISQFIKTHPSTVKQAAPFFAKTLGYSLKKVSFNTRNQSAFFNGKNYISLDIDGHNATNGWKVFDRVGKRIGTWNFNLTKKIKK
ncbi:MAG: hypothetical protein ACI8WB_005758 [Phenylobacterium sp.]|jgi:hypothetical protein